MATSLKQIASCTSSEQSQNGGLIRPHVVFDGGNRSIQWIDPDGCTHCIPSFIKRLDPTWEDAEPGDKSVVIQVGDKHFVIGQAAKDLGGAAVFAGDKVAIARHLALVALLPNRGQAAVRIERLLVALPNSRNTDDVAKLKALGGTHEFTRNGQDIVATVRKVVPIDETRAAYQYAMKRDVFRSKRQLNGVLDLGGGTSIARLYGTSGTVMREADVQLPGTFDLARKVAARLTRQLGESPSLTLIMDGIAAGDFMLGTTGHCFRDAFDISRDEWLNSIKAELKTRWNQWLPSLGEVLIIGGSAPLAQPLEVSSKGRFKIAANPQTISIIGMNELEG